MEEYEIEKKPKIGTIVVCIVILLIVVGFVLFNSEVVDPSMLPSLRQKQTEQKSPVKIDQINDSTYHVNLNNGNSCFTMEKIGDSLALTGVNILMVERRCEDTISVFVREAEGGPVEYKFAYSGFYSGPMPNNDKIGVSFTNANWHSTVR